MKGLSWGLSCLYTTARSNGNKEEELARQLSRGQYDLVGITEGSMQVLPGPGGSSNYLWCWVHPMRSAGPM